MSEVLELVSLDDVEGDGGGGGHEAGRELGMLFALCCPAAFQELHESERAESLVRGTLKAMLRERWKSTKNQQKRITPEPVRHKS